MQLSIGSIFLMFSVGFNKSTIKIHAWNLNHQLNNWLVVEYALVKLVTT
jgi:hypothetical protein